MKQIISCIFCLLLLSSCSSTYKQYDEPSIADCFTGGKKGGYKEYQVSEDQFCISYQGAEVDSHWFSNFCDNRSGYNRVYQFALKRAAEVTREHGFSYFTILSQNQKDIATGAAASGIPGVNQPTYGYTITMTIQCYQNNPPEGSFNAGGF